MARSSSPLPIRHSNSLPRPQSPNHEPIYIDDFDDELAGDTIPCSPGAVLRHDNTTQPTQVLSRPMLEPSSPPSVIEVPASSPYQQPKNRRSLGPRLAPAGTTFRPPPQKRPAPEPIDLTSDDEDDLTPPRGDIRPTAFQSRAATFKAHVWSKVYDADEDQKEKGRVIRDKIAQIQHIVDDRYTVSRMREALQRKGNDVERAAEWLQKNDTSLVPKPSAPPRPSGRRLLSKATLQARSSKPSPASSRTASPSPSKQSEPKRRLVRGLRDSGSPEPKPPKQPKRRLVQGLRKPGTPSPRKPSPRPPSSDDPLGADVIDLVSNDNDDAYQAEPSPTPDEDSASKVLHYINTSTLHELAAMTGMKEGNLEPIIDKRPFNSLAQARKVNVPKKPGARKAPRVSVGESAVEAVEVFLDAVEGIDKVVAKCEAKAKTVKEVMDTWDVNSFGHNKRSGRSTPDQEYPPTPTSLSGNKLCRPPIPKQPMFMDGHCQMKPFQLFGLNWMSLLHIYDIGCILADEMGLGKTCQVISFMSHLVESFASENMSEAERPWPNLIVVPPSTYNNWLAEFEKFAPELSVIGFRGSQSERMEIGYEVEQAPEEYHVVLGTYSQINSEADLEALNSMGLHAAVFDEGHKMKNPETKTYRDLRRIQTDWKMLLTGTPVQNNLLEMTALLNFINPRMFEGYMAQIKYIFSQKVTIRDVGNGAFLYSERVNRARTILEPFILQRRKDQVLSDLPQKTNNVVLCDMPGQHKSVYNEYATVFRMEPSQRASRAVTGRGNDQNNVWMQLRKAAIHPLLFRRHFTDDRVQKMAKLLMDNVSQAELHQPNLGHLVQELKNSSDFEMHLWCRDYPGLLGKFDYPPGAELDSGKIRKLLELVREYQKNGDRVLVFSKFSRMIELLQEILAMNDIDHRVFMGSTAVAERQEMIDEFNNNPEIPVFLLTTGAGGTGINLTSANKVIIFDQSDNPQDDIQAENRAHRLGQKRDVEVIRLISRGTIEDLIHKACQKKIELANKVTGAENVDAEEVEKNMEQEVRKMMEEQMTPP